jgi:hypothetical protein
MGNSPACLWHIDVENSLAIHFAGRRLGAQCRDEPSLRPMQGLAAVPTLETAQEDAGYNIPYSRDSMLARRKDCEAVVSSPNEKDSQLEPLDSVAASSIGNEGSSDDKALRCVEVTHSHGCRTSCLVRTARPISA